MKRLSLFLIIILWASLNALAQNISVLSFNPLPMDMTAASLEGKRLDQNNEVCALIKIVTTEKDFAFEAGALGIVGSQQRKGEIWVWVPRGSRKITILHQQLGVLRDYRYPIEIEAERTYEMVLVTGKIETIVKEDVHQQYLAFQITPPNASLEVNDQLWEVDGDGTVMKYVEFGSYTYRVQASGYHPDAGKVVVNDPENTQIVTITLRPNFGWIEVKNTDALAGASVYIDNDLIGKVPCKSSAIKSGPHTVRIAKEMYETHSETVTVNDNETTIISPSLKANYAEVTLKVDADAEIWVNNEKKGVRTWTGRLGKGIYKFECKKEGHESSQTSQEITADMNGQVITLQPPRAIYGSLNVETTPNFCNLIIDGKSMGTTPKSITEILVGQHELLLTKEGYAEHRETIVIKKGERLQLQASLNKMAAEPEKPAVTLQDDQMYNGEGMWLPTFVSRLNNVDMQKVGLNLSREELYSINNNSLKDAIVGLASDVNPRSFFCTGEIVSEHGLLFTNHHCGYGAIQKLSSDVHDYLRDGFWAKNYSEELPVPEMTASFLIRMEDVTASVLSVVKAGMDYQDQQSAIRRKIREMEEAASENGKYNPVIKGCFEGNEYYMFVYQVFQDVRLVGTPNSSIGKFGGDTDNWMWPRHTGDFSIFRVYADKSGRPAAYSKNNVPLTPKHHLPISLKGVQQDDFTMVWGFPGSTERYMTSHGIDYNVDVFYPIIIDIFGTQLAAMEEYMKVDKHINLMYADNHAGLANTYKNFQGQCQMIRKNKVGETKVALENDFTRWVNSDANRRAKYGNVLPNLKKAYNDLGTVAKYIYYPNFVSNAGVAGIAAKFSSYYQAYEDKDKDQEATALSLLQAMNVDDLFAETDLRVEKKTLAALLKAYKKAFRTDELPEVFDIINNKFGGNIDAFAEDVYTNSIFATPKSVKDFLAKPQPKKIGKDYAYIINTSMMNEIMNHIADYRGATQAISEYDHLFVKGLREYYAATQPKKLLYPDANSTMRMSLGKVKDYTADNQHFNYYCTAQGILDKYVKGDYEFDAPERLINLLNNRDYGRYADKNGNLIVSFITTNDITGGNSGSPVINGKGELIGVAFDGNWEAMSGDICYEKQMQRTICLDIRYLLFIIDKYAGATNIINEIDIHF